MLIFLTNFAYVMIKNEFIKKLIPSSKIFELYQLKS